MAADWRRDLSFADRMAATTKMQAEYDDLIAKAVEDLQSYGKAAAATTPGGDTNPLANVAVDPPTSGAVMARYINAQHHRDGLFSEIFKATLTPASHQPGQPTVFALKVTNPDAESPPHNSRREAQLLQRATHSRIIPLLETFTQPGGRLTLVFPFLPYTLATLLAQNTLTPLTRRTILRDLFSALSHLHTLNILHRDIKPTNILLASPTGPAYLADFGIAWSPSSSAQEPADAKILDVGTTCYRPPELLFGHGAYGTKLDMWAAGCTAAEVVGLPGGTQTLFDAGALGSELALIRSVFETLGTPDLARWPEAATFPDWGKMNFRQYPGKPWRAILPSPPAEAEGVDLVRRLVVFESGDRLSAEEALRHPYLQSQAE